MMSRSDLDRLTKEIIGAAIEVHRALGPGLLESAYQACLAHELAMRALSFQQQFALPLHYKGTKLDCGYRLDFIVESTVIVELKSVQSIDPIHEAQLLSYLKPAQCPVGLLINFNVQRLVDGVTRRVLTY